MRRLDAFGLVRLDRFALSLRVAAVQVPQKPWWRRPSVYANVVSLNNLAQVGAEAADGEAFGLLRLLQL